MKKVRRQFPKMKFTTEGYRPRIGDRVIGNWSKREITGRILENPRRPGKPWIFQSRTHTALLCYIDTGGRKVAVTNLRHPGAEWGHGELTSKQLRLPI